MQEHIVEALQISDRRSLASGTFFKTIKGTGPKHAGTPVGVYSVFLCRRLYRKRSRLYAEATDQKTGSVHDLYLDGPAYTSCTGARCHPYRIRLMTAAQVERLTSKKRRKGA